METSIKILRKAYERGMTFFDTARAYSDSDEKLGNALSDVQKNIFIAAKTMGFKAVFVKGNPKNYNSRGFFTSADYGIAADSNIYLPHKAV